VLLSRSSFAALDPDAPQQVLVLSDLTEQKSREEALQRQSQQLQALKSRGQGHFFVAVAERRDQPDS
jgi:hypothetical protein